MSNRTNSHRPAPRPLSRPVWRGAAALVAFCGTALASDNTALLLRSDLVPDGEINWNDLNAFLTAFGKGDRAADVNADGRVNGDDMTAFLNTMGQKVTRQPEAPPPPAKPAPSDPPTRDPSPAPTPAPAPAPTGDFRVTYDGSSLVFGQGGREILRHTGSLWRKSASTSANATVSVVEKEAGFDLVFNLDNTKRRAQKLGSIVLDGFTLGQAIRVRDFRAAGADIAIDDAAAAPMRDGLSYPSEWYSPAVVLQSDVYTMGVSIQYPILDYKHEVRLSVRPLGDGRQRVEVELNDSEGPVGYSSDGELQGFSSRRYVVSVRVQPASEQAWVNVLEPYREYFAALYGRPQYDRDPRPVHAAVMATPSAQGSTNVDGYLFDDLRPDVHGFGPWAQELAARARLGWERFMIWRPSGLPSNARGVNKGCGKFEFASPLLTGPRADALVHLPRFDTNGTDLGMWWGNPVKDYNARPRDYFNPEKPADVAAALREVDAAVAMDVETIGLERFNHLPAWRAYPWLTQLRQESGAMYITEPACGDLLHTLAGAFLIAQPDPQSPSAGVDSRFYLADFLVPGHETWGMIRLDRLGYPSDEAIRDEVMRLADFGIVPVVVPPIQIDRRIVAEETWRNPEW